MGDTTIDGQPLTLGMRVWDYDLTPTTVESVCHVDTTWADGREVTWYNTRTDDGHRGLFDAQRVWFRHPSTGAKA
jgi:hypothetical protein